MTRPFSSLFSSLLVSAFHVVCLCLAQSLLAATASPATAPSPKPGAAATELSFTLASKGLPREGRWKSRPVLADVNGDGILDLIAHPRLGTQTYVWLGDGHGTWRQASAGLQMFGRSCGGGVQVADVNEDGKPDLVVADHCEGIFVYLGDGTGHWKPVTIKLNPALAARPDVLISGTNPFQGAEGVAVGDIDGDGKPDLVASASDRGGFAVYHGDGTGSHWEETAHHGLPRGAELDEKKDQELGGWANDLMLWDMDGDGHLDLVASYYKGPRVWRGDGKGHFTDWSEGLPQTTAGGLFRRVAVGDMNHDGRPDIAVSRMNGGLAVYLQKPGGGFRDASPNLPVLAIGSEAVAIGDLTGDGRAELIVATRAAGDRGYGLVVLRLSPAGTWAQVPVSGLPQSGQQVIWGIAMGDVDRDGRNDLAVASGGDMFAPKRGAADTHLPHIQVWLNRPARGGVAAVAASPPEAAKGAGQTQGAAPSAPPIRTAHPPAANRGDQGRSGNGRTDPGVPPSVKPGG